VEEAVMAVGVLEEALGVAVFQEVQVPAVVLEEAVAVEAGLVEDGNY
jgi:hypothetical protein